MADILSVWDETNQQWVGIPAIQGAPGAVYELLWTNSNTATAFAQQTVSLDLSKYQFVRVEFSISGATTATVIKDGAIGATTDVEFNQAYQNKLREFSRDWKPETTGVTFYNAVNTTEGGTTATTNTLLVPYKIWGLYQPPQALTPTDLLSLIYPVGSIYMSVNNVSPQTFLGGTWEQIQDTFLLAAGTNHAAASTGGSETVTLTTDQIPSHYHTLPYNTDALNSTGSSYYAHASGQGSWYFAQVMNKTTNSGGGQAHDNMPPYLAVYMWKRTA